MKKEKTFLEKLLTLGKAAKIELKYGRASAENWLKKQSEEYDEYLISSIKDDIKRGYPVF